VEFEHKLLWWRPPAQDEQDRYAYSKLASEISSIFAEQFHELMREKAEYIDSLKAFSVRI
jgi:hypothetical protein